MPPRGAARNTGNWLANPTEPSSKDEPVIRYTSQDCATLCIQVPISEMSWPLKNSWKLRWRKDLRVAGSQPERPAPFPELADKGFSSRSEGTILPMMRGMMSVVQIAEGSVHFLVTSQAPSVSVELSSLSDMATSDQLRIERRSGHRFDQYQVPVQLRCPDGRCGNGYALNLSSRGALVWTDLQVSEGQALDITLVMPAEISMAQDTSVRCKARVVRLQENAERAVPAVALRIEHYEFLPREIRPVQHVPAEVHASR